MEEKLMKKFEKKELVERLNTLLKVICCNQIMIDFQLQEEMFAVFEIKEAIEGIE